MHGHEHGIVSYSTQLSSYLVKARVTSALPIPGIEIADDSSQD